MTEFFCVLRHDRVPNSDEVHPDRPTVEEAFDLAQEMVQEGIGSSVHQVRNGLGREIARFDYLGKGRYQLHNLLAETVKVKTLALH